MEMPSVSWKFSAEADSPTLLSCLETLLEHVNWEQTEEPCHEE